MTGNYPLRTLENLIAIVTAKKKTKAAQTKPAKKTGVKAQVAAKSKAKTKTAAKSEAPAKAKTAAKPKAPAAVKVEAKPKVAPRKRKKGGKSVGSATLAAILGFGAGKKTAPKGYVPNGNASIKTQWKKYYDTLIEIHERLVDQMHGLAKESAEEMTSYSLHMADSGTDNFDRDFALSLLSSDQDAVYEIEEALKRIEKNAYGICELTGKAIPKARLTAIPWTRFTVEAQAQLERDGALRSRKLGSLGSVDSTGTVEIEDDSDSTPDKGSKEKA